MSDEVNADYVASVGNDKTVYLIDVRDTSELEKTGIIPGSINIPLAKLTQSLNLKEDDFFRKYKRNKPNIESPLVFICLLGRRSLIAIEIARNLGFLNVKHYPGGWQEWEQKYKNVNCMKPLK